jgi:hypothetical protein
MERIHSKNDLLQGARGHHPDEHAVGTRQVEAFSVNSGPIDAHESRDARERRRLKRKIQRSSRALKILDVPAQAGDKGDDAWRTARHE